MDIYQNSLYKILLFASAQILPVWILIHSTESLSFLTSATAKHFKNTLENYNHPLNYKVN